MTGYDRRVTLVSRWRSWVTLPDTAGLILLKIKRMESLMADVSQVLNDVADGLRGPLATSIQALLAENVQLRATNAELSGEDVAESAAADNVAGAFNDVSGLFAPADVPVDPIDPIEVPEAPADGGTVTDGGTDAGSEPEPVAPGPDAPAQDENA